VGSVLARPLRSPPKLNRAGGDWPWVVGAAPPAQRLTALLTPHPAAREGEPCARSLGEGSGMQDQVREVNTRCPRCALPIVWAARPGHDGERLEVLAILCRCPLEDEEWDDLARQLAEALDGAGDNAPDGGNRRKREVPPA
jgi:hypothetical protein